MSKKLSAQIEALLFYHGEPIERGELAEACEVDLEEVQKALAELKSNLQKRGLALIEKDSTVQLRTDAELSSLITRFRKKEINTDLTDPQAEALSVIAYLQPATKPDIDFIRGVNSRTVLRNLQTRGLVEKGKHNSKAVYELTPDTLAHLGVTKAEELPQYQSTRQKLAEFTEATQETGGNQQN